MLLSLHLTVVCHVSQLKSPGGIVRSTSGCTGAALLPHCFVSIFVQSLSSCFCSCGLARGMTTGGVIVRRNCQVNKRLHWRGVAATLLCQHLCPVAFVVFLLLLLLLLLLFLWMLLFQWARAGNDTSGLVARENRQVDKRLHWRGVAAALLCKQLCPVALAVFFLLFLWTRAEDDTNRLVKVPHRHGRVFQL